MKLSRRGKSARRGRHTKRAGKHLRYRGKKVRGSKRYHRGHKRTHKRGRRLQRGGLKPNTNIFVLPWPIQDKYDLDSVNNKIEGRFTLDVNGIPKEFDVYTTGELKDAYNAKGDLVSKKSFIFLLGIPEMGNKQYDSEYTIPTREVISNFVDIQIPVELKSERMTGLYATPTGSGESTFNATDVNQTAFNSIYEKVKIWATQTTEVITKHGPPRFAIPPTPYKPMFPK